MLLLMILRMSITQTVNDSNINSSNQKPQQGSQLNPCDSKSKGSELFVCEFGGKIMVVSRIKYQENNKEVVQKSAPCVCVCVYYTISQSVDWL